METEYIEKENSKATVLFVHGILGSPERFKDLYDLVPPSFSIMKLILPGHGKTTKEFHKSSINEWRKCVHESLLFLKEKKQRVIYVGHSMGTLFGIEESLNGDLIDSLFLLNVPLKPHMTFSMLTRCLKVVFQKENKWDFQTKLIKENCSIKLTKNIFAYLLWIPRYIELFKEMRYARHLIPKIVYPCMCFHSKKDELVSQKTYKWLKGNSNIEVFYQENSTHYFNDGEGLKVMKEEFSKLMEAYSKPIEPFQTKLLKELRKNMPLKEIK